MEYVEEELNVYIGPMMQLLNKLNYTQNINIKDGKLKSLNIFTFSI